MSKRKIVPKRTTLLQKLAYILRPFVIYMLIKTVAMLTLALLIPSLPIAGIEEWVEENSYLLSAVVNSAASVIAVSFLLRDFLKEAAVCGEVDIDAGVPRQLWDYIRSGFQNGAAKAGAIVLCVAAGAASAFALNALIGHLSVQSAKYETVEQIQYSVPFALGLVLYGLISPIVEEIVFRGIVFNRIKKFYDLVPAVVYSALLFGAFHANLPQFVYGTCMGALMAIAYARTKCFGAPVAFHMAANVAVFAYSFL